MLSILLCYKSTRNVIKYNFFNKNIIINIIIKQNNININKLSFLYSNIQW